jgi:hypothetical protein
MEVTTAPEGLREQQTLIDRLEAEGGWDIIVGDAFVRGMRDIGYKSTYFALAELLDNSIQASSTQVDIVFGFDTGTKPTRIGIIDDGYGMQPKMVRACLMWGAGTRADNRDGFGKYGYGLPSASVSQCRRVTVYSKVSGYDWHSCYLDIDEISRGEWTENHRLKMPVEKQEVPPAFVIDYLKKAKRWDEFDHGTVVVWDRLDPDRVDAKQRDRLRDGIVGNLGVIYRNFLLTTPMTVDGVKVQPCDPLFITEGFRGYDIDDDRAIGLPAASVGVKDQDTGEVLGRMRVRYAHMPATFFRKPEAKHTNKPGRGQTNERLDIADANNGIIFCREGRQIDVIRPPRSLGSINATTDRFWAVEVDFDATLDDLFQITTSKQQVRPHEKIWDILKDGAKLFTNIGVMRQAYSKDAADVADKAEKAKEQKRASVVAIEAGAKFRPGKAPQETPERAREAQENLRLEARQRANIAGVAPELVERHLIAQQEGNPHAVETVDRPDAPFFRCTQLGGQRVLELNLAHPFYTDLYMGPGSTPWVRAGLEVLLWALGEAEVDAEPGTDKRTWYQQERSVVWSPYVAAALPRLKDLPLMEAQEEPPADGDADVEPPAA